MFAEYADCLYGRYDVNRWLTSLSLDKPAITGLKPLPRAFPDSEEIIILRRSQGAGCISSYRSGGRGAVSPSPDSAENSDLDWLGTDTGLV